MYICLCGPSEFPDTLKKSEVLPKLEISLGLIRRGLIVKNSFSLSASWQSAKIIYLNNLYSYFLVVFKCTIGLILKVQRIYLMIKFM